MEAGTNSDNSSQDNIKQEIKVEDFFLIEQNINPPEKTDKDNETNENPSTDAALLKIEDEVKIRKQIIF
jgi:hypothetical protein